MVRQLGGILTHEQLGIILLVKQLCSAIGFSQMGGCGLYNHYITKNAQKDFSLNFKKNSFEII